ncbi:MAG: hypothetical protein HKL86_00980 [Acidimicrobiaceae bacterium]|nr:hypothetical protein [Acidimicrobiaceae bacterium]
MTSVPSPRPAVDSPAYYAQPRFLHRIRWQQWWTVLHPPYTMLHLSLVTIGSCLTGPVNVVKLVITLLAFFLAVGVGAHSLDELHGRPLRTTIPSAQLIIAASVGLGGAVALGIVGLFVVSGYLAVFIIVGVMIAIGYNLEIFNGRLHTGTVLILGWGAFPVLTAYFAQHDALSVASLFAAAFGALITKIQQVLSTPARELRRRTMSVTGVVVNLDGTTKEISRESLLLPLERALKILCWTGTALAISLVLLRFHP